MKASIPSEQFCLDLLKIGIEDTKALAGIIMALASELNASSPTELSLSPFFQYHYSILGKTMHQLGEQLNEPSSLEFRSHVRQLLASYLPHKDTYKLSSDFTPLRKGDSPKLAGRGFVQIPNNRISSNKPIDIGYYLSYVNVGLYDDAGHPAWSLPLDVHRVDLAEDKIEVAVRQLGELLRDADLPFAQAKQVVNTADSGYALAAYVSPLLADFAHLLLIIRLRHGLKVYRPYQGAQKGGGRPKTYDQTPLYLQTQSSRKCYNPRTKTYFEKQQTPIFDVPPDEEDQYTSTTTRGRKVIVQLFRWNNMLIRGERGHDMSDKPFDLIGVRFIDAQTGELIFQREMFIALWGEQRNDYSLRQTQIDYRHRYDIEPHNRFSKQALLLDKYQTPVVEHLDGWMWAVLLAFWLLFTARKDVQGFARPWEKYLPSIQRAKNTDVPLTPAMTRRGTKKLFSTFDLAPFQPKESKNGRGRKKGYQPTPRKNHPPRKKAHSVPQKEPHVVDSS